MSEHREGAWTGVDAPPLQPADWRRIALESGGLAGGAAVLAACASSFGLGLPALAVTLGFGGFGLAGRHADDRRKKAYARVQALREEFGVGQAWIVDLMVRQGDVPTGCDQGLMWVEGGRVMFSGFRTSFAIAPEQVVGKVVLEPGIPGLRHRLNLRLARQTPVGPLTLSFWPLAESLRRAEDDATNLRYAMNTVLDARWTQRPPTEGQWPPVALGPGMLPVKAILNQALARVVGWSSVTLFLTLALFSSLPWAAVVGSIVLVAGVNLAIARENAPRWRAYRDARRLMNAPATLEARRASE